MTEPIKYGARMHFSFDALYLNPDEWVYLTAGNEWYNHSTSTTIADEDMPWELKSEEDKNEDL